MKFTLVYTIPLMVFVTFHVNSQSQLHPSVIQTDNPDIRFFQVQQDGNKPKVNYFLANPDGSKAEVFSNRFIVKLADVPRTSSVSGQPLTQVNHVAVQSQHAQFRADLNAIRNATPSLQSAGQALRINHEYSRVFNGFAIEANDAMKQQISQLSYVVSITEDKQVKAIDLTSSQQINADDVWTQFNSTGKNVNIGIIDTGIDYLHPDLGGGFGPSFKVKGGYDFVNNDADPMDDNNHGTHVAGIAAGNGPGLKGVAPDANLYAYKVLAAEGYGYDSWILAAIERVVDPDQNPSTDDKLDVVNMSLGRSGDANDPMSEAVTNAIAQGVTFCIAAGNSYDYETIGVPGLAENAITVAATDANGFTANFSSKGPTANTFQIKPDVAAPGVNIYSSVPGGLYDSYSGTSMATPHVTGAVALLLEKNPTWTPAMIKGALMGTAVNTYSELIWHQGAGQIDVLAAIQSECTFSPGSISLGVSDHSSPTWITTKIIRLDNLTSNSKSFTISAEGNQVGSNISISTSPSSVIIPAHSYQDIEVTFEIDVANLPTLSYPEAYTGFISATSGSLTTKAPYAFLHSPTTTFHLTGELPFYVFVVGTDPGNHFFKVLTPAPELNVMLPEGTFDLIANYTDNYYVIKENVTNTSEGIVFNKSQADNHVQFLPKTKEGEPLTITEYIGTSLLYSPIRNFMTLYFGPAPDFHISDQQAYALDFKLLEKNPLEYSAYYDISLSTGTAGITGNMEITNTPADFSELTLENPSVETGAAQGLTTITMTTSGWAILNQYPRTIGNPLKIITAKHQLSSGIVGFSARLTPDEDTLAWQTPIWDARTDETSFLDYWGKQITSLSNSEAINFKLGATLPKINGHIWIGTEQFSFGDFPQSGLINRFMGEAESGTISYEIVQDEEVLKTGSVNNVGEFGIGFIEDMAAGPQTLKLHYPDYVIDVINGSIDASIKFNAESFDPYPPYLQLLSLERAGKSSNFFSIGTEASIRFSMGDCQNCDNSNSVFNTALYYRKWMSETWAQLDLENISNNNHEAALPENLSAGYYDLKIVSADEAGNELAYEVKPAFRVKGSAIEEKIVLLQPVNNHVTSRKPVFKWLANEEANTYRLEVDDNPDFNSPILTKPSLTSTTLTTTALLDLEKQYYWRVRGSFDSGTGAWSDISSFITDDNEWNPVLLQPANGSTDVSLQVLFKWSAVDNSGSNLQISEDIAFDELVKDIHVSSTEKTISLSPNKNFYWRVRSVAVGVWSDTFSFSTADIIVLQSPEEGYITDINEINFTWIESNSDEYILQIADNNSFHDPSYNEAVIGASHNIQLAEGKKYFWRVRQTNANDLWSESRSFTIQHAAPALISPEDLAKNIATQTTLEWEDTGAANYLFEVSTDVNFEDVLYSEKVSENTADVELSAATSYFWHVKEVRDLAAWSDSRAFTTASGVELIMPDDESTSVATPVKFEWKAFEDADSYKLVVSKDEKFANIVLSKALMETSYIAPTLEPSSIYYWKVSASAGTQNISSSTFMFMTTVGSINLLQPQNKASGQSFSLQFKWSKSNTNSYLIQVSTDSVFTALHTSKIVSDTTIAVAGLIPDTKYFWRVKAWISGSAWTSVYNFQTLKPQLTLKAPANHEESVSLNSELKWSKVTDAYDYTVKVSDKVDFSHVIFEKNVNAVSTVVDDLNAATEFFWKVGANFDDVTFWSEPFSFKTVILTLAEHGPDTEPFTIFPNPSTGSVAFRFFVSKPSNTSIDIINAVGTIIHQIDFGLVEGNKTGYWDGKTHDQSEVSNGLYFVILRTESRATALKLTVKR
jgi:subtilisin family serine protease